jgi:class 3 adenylate cyclase
MLLGQAHAAAGDDNAARLEIRAARSAFQRLGAALDLRRVDELLGDEGSSSSEDRRRVTKTFMFTDIVTSTDLVGLIGDAAWEDLLHWHDRALRSAFASHGGQEVRHTGDGFFVTFDRARDAVECAVAIQRRLADHRREHGFALWVRIGVHMAEATREGNDYSGQGVHAAARVGALADREEIVISGVALREAGVIRFPVSEPRSVTLKGISEPVEVHTIDWR